MDHRKYSLKYKKPYVCLTDEERRMEQSFASQNHDLVELVGGPQDGRRMEEVGRKFEHNPHMTYLVDGSYYRPWKMDGHVLKMRYVGRGG
jgi:hypothetical protein